MAAEKRGALLLFVLPFYMYTRLHIHTQKASNDHGIACVFVFVCVLSACPFSSVLTWFYFLLLILFSLFLSRCAHSTREDVELEIRVLRFSIFRYFFFTLYAFLDYLEIVTPMVSMCRWASQLIIKCVSVCMHLHVLAYSAHHFNISIQFAIRMFLCSHYPCASVCVFHFLCALPSPTRHPSFINSLALFSTNSV